MRTKEAGEEEEKEEGSHRGSLVEGRSSYGKLDRRENNRPSTPGWQLLSPEAQGWCPCLAVASICLIQFTVSHQPQVVVTDTREEPNQYYLLWFTFTCLEMPGGKVLPFVTTFYC